MVVWMLSLNVDCKEVPFSRSFQFLFLREANCGTTEKTAMRVDLLFIICFYAAVSLPQAEACQVEKLQKCPEALGRGSVRKFVYTKEEIHDICKILDGFLICLNDSGCQSIPDVATMADRMRASTNLVCKDRFDEFLKYEPCTNSENVKKAQDFCAKEAKVEGKSNCENSNRVLSCFLRSVANCCGSDARNFVDEFLRVMLKSSDTTSGDCEMETYLDVKTPQFCSKPTVTAASAASTISYNILVVLITCVLSLQ